MTVVKLATLGSDGNIGGPGGSPMTGVPSPNVEGLTLYGFGNSYMAVGATICQRRYMERLSSRLRSGNIINDGVGGWLMEDACNFAHGSFTATTARGSVAGTWSPAAMIGGILVVEGGRNSAGWDGLSPTKARAGFTNALDSLLRLLRAGSSLQDTNAAFTYTGTWTSQAGNTFSGGNAHYTSTPGDKATIITPSGTDFDLILTGFDTTVTGAAFTVSVDGVDITASLAAAGYPTTLGFQLAQNKMNSANWIPLAVPLRGLSAGTHTVVVTHAGSAGQFLYVNRLLTPSATPLQVVVNKIAQIGATGYAQYTAAGAGWATDQVYNGIIDQVVARHVSGPADQSIVVYDPSLNGWDYTTMIASTDAQQIHPNDLGMANYANGMLALLNTLPARKGMVVV